MKVRVTSLQRIVFLIAMIATIGALPMGLEARQDGISGRTFSNGAGCGGGGCHGAGPSVQTQVYLQNTGTTSLAPGQTINLTAVVNHQTRTKAGINVSVKTARNGGTNAGLLETDDPNMGVSNGEIVHTQPRFLSNNEALFPFKWTAPTTPGTYYLHMTGNAVNDDGGASGDDLWQFGVQVYEYIVSSSVTVTPIAPTNNSTFCASTQQTIRWTTNGSLPNITLRYSLTGGGNLVAIATNITNNGTFTWNVPAGISTTNGVIVFENPADNRPVGSITGLTINSGPRIQVQPSNQTLCEGGNLNLAVFAAGTNLTYRWFKGTTELTGRTEAALVINGVVPADAGDYSVRVTDACGTVTSNTATVVVGSRPAITQQLFPVSVCEGAPFSLAVTATGSGIRYRWKRAGVTIFDTTANQISIPSARPADSAVWTVEVYGSCTPAVTSDPVLVTVRGLPRITAQSSDLTLCEGSAINISVDAVGTQLAYTWLRDNRTIGFTGRTVSIPQSATTDGGVYRCIVRGACTPPDTSDPIRVVVNPKPAVLTQSSDVIVAPGRPLLLFVQVAGTGLTYLWNKNGTDLANERDSVFRRTSAVFADSGVYYCTIRSACGQTQTSLIRVRVTNEAGPILTLSAPTYSFGRVRNGATRVDTVQNFLINAGQAELEVTGATIGGANSSLYSFGTTFASSVKIGAGQRVAVRIQHAPCTGAGDRSATVTFTSNSSLPSPSFAISSTCVELNARTQDTIRFGSTVAGAEKTEELVITNLSSASALRVTNITIGGPGQSAFRLSATTLPLEVPASGRVTVPVTFVSTAVGDFAATLSVQTEFADTRFSTELRGTATPASVKELAELGLQVYPNPSDGQIWLSGRTGGVRVRLHTLPGELLLSRDLGSVDSPIALFDGGFAVPAAGVYLLVVETQSGVSTVPVTIY